MRVKYVLVKFIKCPSCGSEYESLIARPSEPWKCGKCGFVFAEHGEEIPRKFFSLRGRLRC